MCAWHDMLTLFLFAGNSNHRQWQSNMKTTCVVWLHLLAITKDEKGIPDIGQHLWSTMSLLLKRKTRVCVITIYMCEVFLLWFLSCNSSKIDGSACMVYFTWLCYWFSYGEARHNLALFTVLCGNTRASKILDCNIQQNVLCNGICWMYSIYILHKGQNIKDLLSIRNIIINTSNFKVYVWTSTLHPLS